MVRDAARNARLLTMRVYFSQEAAAISLISSLPLTVA
jgi:hypothetical protein